MKIKRIKETNHVHEYVIRMRVEGGYNHKCLLCGDERKYAYTFEEIESKEQEIAEYLSKIRDMDIYEGPI